MIDVSGSQFDVADCGFKATPFKVFYWPLSPSGERLREGLRQWQPMALFTAHGPHPRPLPEGEGAKTLKGVRFKAHFVRSKSTIASSSR
jgi:hypothetical protein